MEYKLIKQLIVDIVEGSTILFIGWICNKLYLRYKTIKAKGRNIINEDDEPFGFF